MNTRSQNEPNIFHMHHLLCDAGKIQIDNPRGEVVPSYRRREKVHSTSIRREDCLDTRNLDTF